MALTALALPRVAAQDGQEQTRIIHGLVGLANGRLFQVESEEGHFEAVRAHSCLVEPIPGDLVLVSRSPGKRAYILSILERREGQGSTLVMEGDTQLRVEHGSLGLTAENIGLLGGREISLASPEVDLHAEQGTLSITRLVHEGESVHSEAGQIKLFAGTLDTIAGRITQHAKRCLRWVEGLDQICAGRLRGLVDGALTMESKRASIVAEEEVKIEGEEVHLG